ncbi:hypothetical protein KQ874_00355 [Mycoplasma sp. ES3157-GEN-MYC]|uniref:Uncharacterized protein n=1 Tax=Mycoplasma miroungigenitalium TaxID=754515 RepID=A0A6M4J8G5_9MOLU|nr:hypothetical protein [Mycoplasma miroungigenitalium]MBU4690156.1 hypothetical protein [Mycoplasma miroungigenitalium]MBU4691428.1 hypothetical protein [Mycoplasma miroungigenitalium]QJR43264.1 hypothetical protein HLA87_00365 [Mycoplasma miroungigenitalium]
MRKSHHFVDHTIPAKANITPAAIKAVIAKINRLYLSVLITLEIVAINPKPKTAKLLY